MYTRVRVSVCKARASARAGWLIVNVAGEQQWWAADRAVCTPLCTAGLTLDRASYVIATQACMYYWGKV